MSTPIAFLDVDTQVDFMEPDGKLYVPGAEELIPNLGRLLEAARGAGIPILATADDHQPGDPELEVFPPHCMHGTKGQQRIPATRGAAGEVITKREYDAWSNPRMGQAVAEIGAATWVVFGVATDYCVKAAAYGLLERGLGVILVTDAIKPVDPAAGEDVLVQLIAAGARTADTAEILARLGPEGEEPT